MLDDVRAALGSPLPLTTAVGAGARFCASPRRDAWPSVERTAVFPTGVPARELAGDDDRGSGRTMPMPVDDARDLPFLSPPMPLPGRPLPLAVAGAAGSSGTNFGKGLRADGALRALRVEVLAAMGLEGGGTGAALALERRDVDGPALLDEASAGGAENA